MAFISKLWYNWSGGCMYSNSLVCEILKYLNNNINKEITINELSLLFFFDKTYIMKRFKKELGITIHEYINIIRVYNSLSYFKDDNYFLSIAFNNGFNSLEYFSETFKKVLGVSPRSYKKFVNRDIDLTVDDEIKVLHGLSNINHIKNKTDSYLLNQKPSKYPVKKIVL